MGALFSLFRFLWCVGDFLHRLEKEQRREAANNANNANTTDNTNTNANNTNNTRPNRRGIGSMLRWMTRGGAPKAALPPAPVTCPICLEKIAPPTPSKSQEVPEHSIKLARCVHTFCHGCVRPYVEQKVRERFVEWDQLHCPVVDCKRSLNHRDLMRILDSDGFERYKYTLKRVQDEKNPLARWCPRATCGKLIICESPNATTFTCPRCRTKGCFRCRGPAHRFAFLCRATNTEDASYSKWLESVGNDRAVRACPQCHVRIWKDAGCNHMKCARCRHEYCWVCNADWQRAHYACVDIGIHRRARRLTAPAFWCCVAVIVTVASVMPGRRYIET